MRDVLIHWPCPVGTGLDQWLSTRVSADHVLGHEENWGAACSPCWTTGVVPAHKVLATGCREPRGAAVGQVAFPSFCPW